MQFAEIRLACHAMGTRFEFLLRGSDEAQLRAAGEEALAEILRLHNELSAFRSQSQIGRINELASRAPVPVSAELFRLLRRAQELSKLTDGAFDVTVGPLMSAWGFRESPEETPDPDEVALVLQRTGMQHLMLDAAARTIAFRRPGMRLDLGAIGKGYALDAAKAILCEAGVYSALLHGGTSSVVAIGNDVDETPWSVAVQRPFACSGDDPLTVLSLVDECMSVSAVSGRYFETEDGLVAHVIDPRSGYPVRGASQSIVISSSAADADALSTGLLVLGPDGLAVLDERIDNLSALVIGADQVDHDLTTSLPATYAPAACAETYS